MFHQVLIHVIYCKRHISISRIRLFPNIGVIDNNMKQEQQKNRIALLAIFDSIRFCGQAGIALRRHGDEKESGNLWGITRLIGSKELSRSVRCSFWHTILKEITVRSVNFRHFPISIVLLKCHNINLQI